MIAIACAIILFPDLVDVTIPPTLLPIFATILGVIYLFRLSRQSKVTSWMFLVLVVIVITMGSTLAFPDYDSQIFAIGITIASVILIYTVFRNYKGNKIPVISVTLNVSLPVTVFVSGSTS